VDGFKDGYTTTGRIYLAAGKDLTPIKSAEVKSVGKVAPARGAGFLGLGRVFESKEAREKKELQSYTPAHPILTKLATTVLENGKAADVQEVRFGYRTVKVKGAGLTLNGQPVSATFHGRDIFAPVAAHVAAGERPSRMGRIIEDYVRSGFERPQRTGEQTWTGQVLHIDRFGNIVTNFRATDFPALKNFSLILGSHQVRVLARNYAQCGPGE